MTSRGIKLVLAIFCMIAILSFPALAQAVPHSVSFSYTASSTSGIAGYNNYRAACTGTITNSVCSVTPAASAFTKTNSAVIPGLTYVDSSVTAGAKYVYYFTAVCPAAGCSSTTSGGITTVVQGESGPSVMIAVTIPNDVITVPPNPPGAPTVTNIAMNVGIAPFINAELNAPPLSPLNTEILGERGNSLYKKTVLTDANGKAFLNWKNANIRARQLAFSACNQTGCVTAHAH